MQKVSIPMEELAPVLMLQLEKGTAPLTVTGQSMYPMLQSHRDRVWLQKPEKPLKKGDLILYRRADGSYILHRIVRRPSGGCFVCSGDNQFLPERVESAQIIAVVARFCRNGKHYDVSHWGYGLYVRLWVWLFPVRRPILALRRRLGRLRHAVRKK